MLFKSLNMYSRLEHKEGKM